MYKVNNYFIIQYDNYSVVQTKYGISLLKNKEIIDFLIELEENRVKMISDSDFYNKFSDSGNAILDFLIRNRILEEEFEEIIKLESCFIIYDDEDLFKIFRSLFKCRFSNIKGIEINSEMQHFNLIEIEKYDIIYVLMTKFNLKKYKEINKIIYDKNVIIKNIFQYNDKIYVSNFSKKDWKNPCPICFYSNLESHLRGIVGRGDYNFQTILDIIYNQDPYFELRESLDTEDFSGILYLISYQLKKLDEKFNLSFDRTIDEVFEYDIKNGNISKDIVYHWEICDCHD